MVDRRASRQVGISELAGEPASSLLRIVTWREHPFRASEVRESTTEQETLAKLCGFFVGLMTKDRLQVTKILRTRLITLVRGNLGIHVPQFQSRLKHRGE